MSEMKHLLLILIMVVGISVPLSVYADQVLTEQEAWQYLYEFRFMWDGQRLTQAAPYQITSGDGTTFTSGLWRLEIQDEQRQPLSTYGFDPSAMALTGALTLKVPLEGSGFYAVVYNTVGEQSIEIRVSASRVCDDDGSCEQYAGETWWLCQKDCGSNASGERTTRTAAIAPQMSTGSKVGSLMLRFSLAAAGLMLLIGGWQMLDSRRRP